MGLDFTHIKDEPGSAIFFIHDGTEEGETDFKQLVKEVARRTKKQIILLSADEEKAIKIIDFYDLRGTKFVIIVRDDDQLHHVWSDGERFDPSVIAYTAQRAG